MKNCAMFQKRLHYRDYILLSKLRSSWRFLKFFFYMYIQIETFMYAITSHKKRRAKYQTKMLWWIVKQWFRYKQCFQRNNTLTANTDDQKFNCDNANGHSQTGNWKKNVAKLNSKDKLYKQRQREAPRDFVYTLSIEHLFTNFLLLWIWQI